MIDWFVGYALGKRQVMAMVWAFVSIYGHCSWTACDRSLSGQPRREFAGYCPGARHAAEEG
jgi:hypothetical protein